MSVLGAAYPDAPSDLVCRLPAHRGAPALARTAVRTTLCRWGAPPDLVETALLVTSELVTNSVVHESAGPVLELRRSATGIRICVQDDALGSPRVGNVPPEAEAEAEGGRGLRLIAALAARWGSHPSGPGTTVWAELDLVAGRAAGRLQGLRRRVTESLDGSGVRASVGAASRRPGEVPAHPPQAAGLRPMLVLVPPIRSPLHAGRAEPTVEPSSSGAARRTLIVALHRAGGLTADELVDLQLSDVIDHPSGLVVQARRPWSASGRARRFGLGRQPEDDCPVQAFESWQDLLERAFRAERGRAMQPADRHEQPLFCALGSGGRPTRSRLSAQAVAHVLRAAPARPVGEPPAPLDAPSLPVGWFRSRSAGRGGRP